MDLKPIIDKLEEQSQTGNVFIINKGYEPIPYAHENNHSIEPRFSEATIAAIDGGQAEIVSGNFFNVSLIRTCCVFVTKNHKKGIDKNDYLLIVRMKDKKYIAELFSSEGNLISENRFNLYNPEISGDRFMIPVDQVIGRIRRNLELQTAEKSLEKLSSGDMIVLDGSLRTSSSDEKDVMDGLVKACTEKQVLLSSLSKSSGFMTNIGESFNYFLAKKQSGMFYYHPSLRSKKSDHDAEIFFVRLHDRGDVVFTYEIHKSFQRVDIEKVIGLIASNSKDPVFLGYPYSLIISDRFARVSNDEKAYYQKKVLMLAKKKSKDLYDIIRYNHLHDILDSVS